MKPDLNNLAWAGVGPCQNPQLEVFAGRQYIAAPSAKQTLRTIRGQSPLSNALIYNDAPDENVVNLSCTTVKQNAATAVTSCLPYKSLTRRFPASR